MNTSFTQCFRPDGTPQGIPPGISPVLSEDGQSQQVDGEGRFLWLRTTDSGTETTANELRVFANQQPQTQATPANNMGTVPPQVVPTSPAGNPAVTLAPAAAAPDLNALFQMMANMQAQVLELARARESRSSSDEARAKLFKFGTPDKFDGSKKEKVRGFLDQCNREFEVKPGVYVTDRLKMMYAESYMEGQAADWAREYSTGRVPATWEQFEQLLISTYGGGRNIAATETELIHLRQGTKSLATYITEYNDLLALLPNVCEYMRRAMFRANLNQAFKDAIVPMPGQETMTLAEFQMECRRYEDQADVRRHTSSGNRYNSGGNRQASNHSAPRNPVVVNTTVATPAPAANASTAAPMELDAGRMRRNDPCYRCFQHGHVAVNCPNQRVPAPAWFKGRNNGRMNVSGARVQPVETVPEGVWEAELARQNGEQPLLWTPTD